MLKWIGYLLIALLIIGIITAPSQDKFRKFAEEKTAGSACKPYTDYQSYKVVVTVFGIGHMRECKSLSGIFNPASASVTGVSLPVYGESVTYLGLFGRFWKL